MRGQRYKKPVVRRVVVTPESRGIATALVAKAVADDEGAKVGDLDEEASRVRAVGWLVLRDGNQGVAVRAIGRQKMKTWIDRVSGCSGDLVSGRCARGLDRFALRRPVFRWDTFGASLFDLVGVER